MNSQIKIMGLGYRSNIIISRWVQSDLYPHFQFTCLDTHQDTLDLISMDDKILLKCKFIGMAHPHKDERGRYIKNIPPVFCKVNDEEQARHEIRQALQNVKILYVLVVQGHDIAHGAMPEIIRVAKETGILTVGLICAGQPPVMDLFGDSPFLVGISLIAMERIDIYPRDTLFKEFRRLFNSQIIFENELDSLQWLELREQRLQSQ